MTSRAKHLTNRPSIAFLLPTDLAEGRGIERAVLNYAMHRPPEVDMIIVESGRSQFPRLNKEEIEKATIGVNVLRAELPYFQWQFLKRLSITMGLAYGFAIPAVTWLSRRSNRQVVNALRDVDVVYLFNNAYWPIVPKGPIIVGSTHATPPRHRLARVYAALIRAGILERGIASYHLLRRREEWKFGRAGDFVVPVGIDTSQFIPSEVAGSGPPRFIFVGALEPAKGVDSLLEAWRSLSDRGWQLAVVGDGSLASQVESAPGVDFYRVLSTDHLAQLLRSSDVFVFPSKGESLAAVVLEAVASGVYVISSDTTRGDYDAFAARGRLVYSASDAPSLAGCMASAGDRVEFLRQHRYDAIEAVHQEYDLATNTHRLFEYLLELFFVGKGQTDRTSRPKVSQ